MVFKAVTVKGLGEFNAALRRVPELTDAMRSEVSHDAADLAHGWALGRIPRRTGRAAESLRLKRYGLLWGLSGGDARTAPYYPWLDFGGRTGRKRSVKRQFIEGGRYIYPGFAATVGEAQRLMTAAVEKMLNRAGLGG